MAVGWVGWGWVREWGCYVLVETGCGREMVSGPDRVQALAGSYWAVSWCVFLLLSGPGHPV